MKRITEHIKNHSYQRFYLFYGEEKYLIAQMKQRLKDALVEPEDTMNYAYFEGKKINTEEVIELANTMPFFKEHRLIVLDQTQLAKKTNDDLLEQLKNVPDSTVLIFIEDAVDKRSKIYKFLAKEGCAIEFAPVALKDLSLWTGTQLKKYGKKITTRNMDLLLYKTGTNMFLIRNEIDKLVAYIGEKEVIEEEDIEAVVSSETTNQIFGMIEAIAKRQRKRVLQLYYDLLELQESPFGILALLVRQCNQLLLVKSLAKQNSSKGFIAREAKVPPFVAGKLLSQAKMFHMKELMYMLNQCALTDEGIKKGEIKDRIGVEMLLIEFSSEHSHH